jgi:hypothetical protein
MKRGCESRKAPLGDSAPATSHMFLSIQYRYFLLSICTCQLCLTPSHSWHTITCCMAREQSKKNGDADKCQDHVGVKGPSSAGARDTSARTRSRRSDGTFVLAMTMVTVCTEGT